MPPPEVPSPLHEPHVTRGPGVVRYCHDALSPEVSDLVHSSASVGIRMAGGFACAFAFVEVFGVRGVDRGVLLLMGVMPAAVINAVIAERYETDTGLVASAIVIGTLASLVVIPLVLVLSGATTPG